METLTPKTESLAPAPPGAASRRWPFLLTLAALWAVVFLPRLTHPAIFDDSDAMYAEVPREMLLRGDWITPYANSVRYLEKPPLYYWLIAGCYRLFGVSNASARLPSTLTCLGIILAAYLLGELLFDATAGWVAGAAMATSAGYYLFTQQLMPDPLFTLLLSLTFYCFLRGDREPRPRQADNWHLLAFALMGLSVLAKGLIGLVFPITTLGAYALLRRRAGRPLRLPLGWGVLVFAAVAVPWHALVGIRNPGWAWFYFVNEHVLRFLNRRVPRDYGTVPLPAFWLLHALWLFPWSVFLPLAIADLWRAGWSSGARRRPVSLTPNTEDPTPYGDPRWPDGLLFLGLWAGSVLLLFSFSTRLEYYSMPAFPALAVLIGAAASRAARWDEAPEPIRILRVSLGALVAASACMLLAALALAAWAAHTPAGHPRPLNDPDSPYSVYFFSPLFNLSLDHLRRLVGWDAGVALSAFLGSVIAFVLARRGRARSVPAVLAVSMVFCLGCLHRCFRPFESDISSYRLATLINHHWKPGDMIVVDGLYETYNSLNFYTRRPLHILNARQGYLGYGSRYPDAPPLFLDRPTFERLIHRHAAGRVFLVTRKPQRFPERDGHPRLLRELAGRILLLYGAT